MKKTLLLSVVASTLIMAGGDIAPVEPIVVPVVESGWKFDGNMVAYYQTRDNSNVTPNNSLFGTNAGESWNNFAIQLRAVNDDLFWGVGAGFELSGLSTLKLLSTNAMQTAGSYLNATGGALTQAYLTYNIDMLDTSLKLGRQKLPKSLSPFAFSESWTVLQNTFDAALVVNSSIPDTTLVYAFVDKVNSTAIGADLSSFGYLNNVTGTSDNGVHMITAQNKSFDWLTLTGSFYYGKELLGGVANDTMIGWGDASFNYDGYSIALQGGTVQDSDLAKNTVAYGAKIGAKYNLFDIDFDTSVAYSSVDDGQAGVFNVGGVKTPLYTQLILNQGAISRNSNTVMAKIGADLLGGHFGVAYSMSTEVTNIATNGTISGAAFGAKPLSDNYNELDVTYKAKITDNTTLFTAYVMTDDAAETKARNLIRVWARYNFN